MSQVTRSSWKTIRSVLGESIAKIDSDGPQSIAWFDYQWKLIVGKDLAAVTEVNKYSSKSLFVTLSDGSWLPALEPLREKIIAKINQHAGSTLLHRIIYQEGCLIGPIMKSPIVDKNLCLLAQNKTKQIKSQIKDENIKDIIDRISSKMQVILPTVILLIISNCTALPTTRSIKNIDLSSSYAVKAIEKQSTKLIQGNTDPRSYYYFLMALQTIRDHQFEKASENLRKVIKFNPNAFEFHQQLAINLIRSGKIDDAYEVLEDSLQYFADNPELNMMFGDILAQRQDYDRALNHYQRVIQAKVGLPRAYLLSGSIYEVMKQYDLAAAMYLKVIQVEPNNPLGYHYLGRVNIFSGDLEEAKKHLYEALELRPNNLDSRVFLAWILEVEGEADEAKRQYKIILKLDPLNKKINERMTAMKSSKLFVDLNSEGYQSAAEEVLGLPKVHLKIGAVYYEQAIYLKALDEFQLLRGKQKIELVYMVIGRAYEALGRADMAIREINDLRKQQPDSVHLMIYLARLYNINGQTKQTIRLIEEAISIDQQNDTLYHSLALAYIGDNQIDQAIIKMQKAIEIDKSKDFYYFELGALLERTGEFEKAIKYLKQSIDINPMHSNAHNFLGYMYATHGKSLDKALGHLNKALSIQPKNGYFLDSLGWIYFKKGESEKALSQLKKALVYTSPDPVLYSHLGDIQFSLKNYIEAGKAWKTSLFLTLEKIDDMDIELPDPEELKRKIQKVESGQ
jgi:tetratricopeptide (TPR) repeat protein